MALEANLPSLIDQIRVQGVHFCPARPSQQNFHRASRLVYPSVKRRPVGLGKLQKDIWVFFDGRSAPVVSEL
jgi:hypothetical protein